ncbi:hypothetical protein BV898_03063 [Hypsibius exemplaris]|uniref:Uncharacterized protein n=1 Tax=Hypsibius exemplaris TaxID=2072580 RepID=A0A1W0X699_HYPEX|nr:hypothetical protein BV898_03063 [Hypsibius exemplaris]
MYKSTSRQSIKSDGEDEEVSFGDGVIHGNDGDRFSHHEWTYQIDLQLAAELGKTLLQRNKELERDLSAFQDHAEDQALEIDFLSKQVRLLRDESATRLAACEMLDTQLLELKRSEGSLQEMRSLDYMRITRLQDTVEVLQTRCDELQSQVTEMKRKKWEDKFAAQTTLCATPNGTAASGTGGMTRSITLGDGLKAPSKQGGKDDSDSEDESSPETGILKEKIKVLQRQVGDERKQRQLLQDQVSNVMADNTSLWSQLNQVTHDAASWREKLEHLSAKYTEEITTFNEARQLSSQQQKDDANGEDHTSLPCSSSPLSEGGPQLSILDEIADSLRDRFLDDLRREQQEQQEQEKQEADLTEASPTTNDEVIATATVKCKTSQTDTSLIIDYLASRGGDPTNGRFERGPPEYKKLFKEIFDIIKRSQEEDAMRAGQQPGGATRSRHAKPKKQIVFYHNHF